MDLVVMALLPGRIERGSSVRSGTGYARYSVPSWQHWCARHRAQFLALTAPEFPDIAPSIQRWLALPRLLHHVSRILVVDADTIVRWDAPNVFDQAGRGFAAAATELSHGTKSVAAYRHLFPGVSILLYFNSGIVVVTDLQAEMLETFRSFVLSHWPELRRIQAQGNFGSDQTPLNYIVRQTGTPFRELPREWNQIGCFPESQSLRNVEAGYVKWESARDRILGHAGAFQFLEQGFVYHFTNTVLCREQAMAATWQRIERYYAGAPAVA